MSVFIEFWVDIAPNARLRCLDRLALEGSDTPDEQAERYAEWLTETFGVRFTVEAIHDNPVETYGPYDWA